MTDWIFSGGPKPTSDVQCWVALKDPAYSEPVILDYDEGDDCFYN